MALTASPSLTHVNHLLSADNRRVKFVVSNSHLQPEFASVTEALRRRVDQSVTVPHSTSAQPRTQMDAQDTGPMQAFEDSEEESEGDPDEFSTETEADNNDDNEITVHRFNHF